MKRVLTHRPPGKLQEVTTFYAAFSKCCTLHLSVCQSFRNASFSDICLTVTYLTYLTYLQFTQYCNI